jgi:MFS family permease
MEQAGLQKKGFAPAGSWIILIASWFVFIFNAMASGLYDRLLTLIIVEFKFSPQSLGLLNALLGILASGVGMSIATWADKQGRAYNRRKSNAFVGLMCLGLCFLNGIPWISAGPVAYFAIRFVMGIFRNQDDTIYVATVGEWWPAERRGFALGARNTGFPWGSLIGGFVVAALLKATNNNWRIIHLIVPLCAIPFWIFYYTVNNKKRFAKNEQEIVAMGMRPSVTLEEVEAVGTAADIKRRALEAKSGGEAAQKSAAVDSGSFKDLLKNPNVMVGSFGCFFAGAALFGLNFWLSPYLRFVANYDFAQVAKYSVLFNITGGVGQIFWGGLSDKVGRKTILMLGFLWLAVGYFLLQYVTMGLGVLIALQLFIGCFTNALFPVLYGMIGESAKKSEIGRAMSMTWVISGLTGFMTYAIGLFISLGGGWEVMTGYTYARYFLIGLMLLACLMVFLFSHETSGKRRGRDWALTSYESCGVQKAQD